MSSDVEDGALTPLDEDISDLRAQVASLKRQLKVQTTTLLSAGPVASLLESIGPGSQSLGLNEVNPIQAKVKSRSQAQKAYNQQCLYRICTAVTSFKVLDPDPKAVDGGNVLGIRIEAMAQGYFNKPYYILLNRPYDDSRHFRVHRHTVPAAIPLSGLAARYLPPPQPSVPAEESVPRQDVQQFVRCLRREIVRYHNRASIISELRQAAQLDSDQTLEEGAELDILDIKEADTEAKHITISFADGRAGRLILDDDGRVEKSLVFTELGRDWETAHGLAVPGDDAETLLENFERSRGGRA